MSVPSESGLVLGNGMLLVGNDADVVGLARHLDSAGYAVAYVTPADAVGVMGSFHPAVVMVMPGVPVWQKAQLCTAIKALNPDVTVVVLRKRLPVRTFRRALRSDLPDSIL
jgi:DNA-binding response OmpR family regulator